MADFDDDVLIRALGPDLVDEMATQGARATWTALESAPGLSHDEQLQLAITMGGMAAVVVLIKHNRITGLEELLS